MAGLGGEGCDTNSVFAAAVEVIIRIYRHEKTVLSRLFLSRTDQIQVSIEIAPGVLKIFASDVIECLWQGIMVIIIQPDLFL